MPHSEPSETTPPSDNDNEVLPDAPADNPPDTKESNDATSTNEAGGVKLEDMFNDDDDDEFPAPSAPDSKVDVPSSAPEPAE